MEFALEVSGDGEVGEVGGVAGVARREEDPVAVAGLTMVTRDRHRTFRLLSSELRALAREAGREGQGGGGRKVEVENAEEAGREALAEAGVEAAAGLRYHGMLFQWSRKRKARGLGLLPRTVLLTEEGELVVLVEDLRQAGGRRVAGAEGGGEGLGQGGKEGGRGKFAARPRAGRRMEVLLRVPVEEVKDLREEAGDPREVTLRVEGRGEGGGAERGLGGAFLAPWLGRRTWRFYSEDLEQVEALRKALGEWGGGEG